MDSTNHDGRHFTILRRDEKWFEKYVEFIQLSLSYVWVESKQFINQEEHMTTTALLNTQRLDISTSVSCYLQ